MFEKIKTNLSLKIFLLLIVFLLIPLTLTCFYFYIRIKNLLPNNIHDINHILFLFKAKIIVFFIFGVFLILSLWRFFKKEIINPLLKIFSYLKDNLFAISLSGIKINNKDEIGFIANDLNKITLKLKDSQNIVELLKESTKRFQDIIENLELWVWEINKEFNFIYSNDIVYNILKCRKEYILGKNFFDFLITEDIDKIKTNLIKSIENKQAINEPVLIRAVRTDGQVAYLEFTGITICYSNKNTGFRGVIKDITENKKNIEKMRRWEQRFHQKERLGSLKQLSVGIAHNFNNQLTGIKGFADILKKELKPEDPLQEYVNNIISISKEAAKLNRQLLEFTGEGEKKYIPIDMHKLIESVIELMQKQWGNEIIFFKKYNSKFYIINGDPLQLQQVLFNIIINSKESMSKAGKIEIETNFVKVDETFKNLEGSNIKFGRYLQISIKDEGTGMDRETVSRIFDPFFTTKLNSKNVGMGMSFVHGTILEHNGIVHVYSELNKGTVIKLFMPIVIAEVKENNIYDMSNVMFGNGNKIAIVDDDSHILNSIQQILQIIGYDTIIFTDGIDLKKYYEKNSDDIDIILIDMVLQDIKGEDLLKSLQKINPNLKAVLMSGYNISNITDELLEKGKIEFIEKPFNITDISIKLYNILFKNAL